VTVTGDKPAARPLSDEPIAECQLPLGNLLQAPRHFGVAIVRLVLVALVERALCGDDARRWPEHVERLRRVVAKHLQQTAGFVGCQVGLFRLSWIEDQARIFGFLHVVLRGEETARRL